MHAKRPPAIAREECPSSPNATATSLRCSDVRCRRPGQGGAFLGNIVGRRRRLLRFHRGCAPSHVPWFALPARHAGGLA
jgi:hypothetical protein